MQVVSQLEIQLQKERDRLTAMMHHLHVAKQMASPEPARSSESSVIFYLQLCIDRLIVTAPPVGYNNSFERLKIEMLQSLILVSDNRVTGQSFEISVYTGRAPTAAKLYEKAPILGNWQTQLVSVLTRR